MALTLIANLDPGLQCRNTLNAVIDLVGANHPWTSGSIPYTNSSNDYAQDNTNFFWDAAGKLLTAGNGLKIKGTTSGTVTLNTKAAAGTWALTLPDSAGTSGYALTTDGAGVTSWTAAGAITGATAGRVLFAGVGGILDDDSTFLWNDTLKDLAIGGAYYVNADRALYVVPNVTENNWFEGNAGNQTVTGYGNFGTGDLALSSLTSGYDNVAVGTYAGKSLTSGFRNFAFGSFAMWFGQSADNNTAIGYTALATLGIGGVGAGNTTNNVAIGFSSLSQVEQGSNNTCIGPGTLSSVSAPTTASFNTIIGSGAGNTLGGGGGGSVEFNCIVGANSALNITGTSSRNTFIGGWNGPAATVNDMVGLSSGGGHGLFDLGITKAWTWSLSFKGYNLPTGLHIYNTQDALGVANNYERVVLDWVPNSNICTFGTEAGGTGTLRILATYAFPKAGAPAASDLPSGTWAVIDDTSGGNTWLVYNKAGTIRKVQLT